MARPLTDTLGCVGHRNAKKSKKKKGKTHGGLPASDDVDELLDALASETSGLSVEHGAAARSRAENSLLSVNLGMINADKEMKRIFGVRCCYNAGEAG
jgi:hypothetical protein